MGVIIKPVSNSIQTKALVMKTTTSLCFSADGLLNPESIDFLNRKDIDTVVVLGDGSEDAFQKIREFDYSQLLSVTRIGAVKTPMYDLRVLQKDGQLSRPNYVLNDDIKMEWICNKICTHYINLVVSDITSKTDTRAELEPRQTALLCYQAYRLWLRMLTAESRLCFPATAIDRLTKFTYLLTKETMDVGKLRRDSGLDSLEYNSITDLLSIKVAGDVFEVKLSVLNSFYGDFILPKFNEMLGRRLRIFVSARAHTGQFSEMVEMSYGELGRLVEEMKGLAKETKITTSCPIEPSDLLAFAKKVKIDDDSCLWPAEGQDLIDFFDQSHDTLVRGCEDTDACNSEIAVNTNTEMAPTSS